MVGNIDYVRFMDSGSGSNFRVTHKEDPVPKLPSYLLGYAHISGEYWITSPTGVTPTTSDVSVSSGAYNLKGNGGTLGINGDDHTFYFNMITGCGSGGFEL